MVRLVRIYLSQRDGLVESLLSVLEEMEVVRSITVRSVRCIATKHDSDWADATTQIEFRCIDKHLSSILQSIERFGVGTEHGRIDIHALQTTIPGLRSRHRKRRKKYSVRERQSIREIEDLVDGDSHLTFDFIALTIVGSVISSVGLINDSAVTVVASMLVSPLMGPILCVAYGLAVQRFDMVRLGFRNELCGVGICLLVGCTVGLCCAAIYDAPLFWSDSDNYVNQTSLLPRSQEMEAKGNPWVLLSGLFAAAPTGVGVALALTNSNTNTLVGVAISASLLPPLVNAGISLVIGLAYSSLPGYQHGDRFLVISLFSFALFFMNYVAIVLFALLTFRLKGVNKANRELSLRINTPLESMPPMDDQGHAMKEVEVAACVPEMTVEHTQICPVTNSNGAIRQR